jgi:hypothetical protein
LSRLWKTAVVAEWLRRLTRNQIPSGSAGSNPADCEIFTQFWRFLESWLLFCPPLSCQHRWFSGRMLACHAGGPGSIPGRCSQLFWLSVRIVISNMQIINMTMSFSFQVEKVLENGGIDPPTSHMLSERSTI